MRLFQEVLEILPGEALLMIMVVFLAAVSWGAFLGAVSYSWSLSHHPSFSTF